MVERYELNYRQMKPYRITEAGRTFLRARADQLPSIDKPDVRFVVAVPAAFAAHAKALLTAENLKKLGIEGVRIEEERSDGQSVLDTWAKAARDRRQTGPDDGIEHS